MKEFSKEVIEINGKEYTLFLNRKGIVAWEKYSKKEQEKLEKEKSYYKELFDNNKQVEEITNETNPFEGLDKLDNMSEDEKLLSSSYRKLYWIMLYTDYQFSIEEVNKLYDIACKEYGEAQLIALGVQMIEDANSNLITKNNELKNLKALRPSKN